MILTYILIGLICISGFISLICTGYIIQRRQLLNGDSENQQTQHKDVQILALSIGALILFSALLYGVTKTEPITFVEYSLFALIVFGEIFTFSSMFFPSPMNQSLKKMYDRIMWSSLAGILISWALAVGGGIHNCLLPLIKS